MAPLDQDDLESPRDVELSSLTAIYPEIQQIRPDDPYTIALDIPVTPSKAVNVLFPAAPEGEAPPNPELRQQHQGNPAAANGNDVAVDSHELAHLPSLRLEIAFGERYPAEEPPKIAISTTPPWVPVETVRKLEDDAPRLWEEMGRDMVGFTYIDHVQQCAENVFGLVGDGGSLQVDPQHKIAILDYDIKARKAAFQKETFKCGVCLDPKKGLVCHKMLDCGHVFCVDCLQEFYNNAIKEGDLNSVRCLAPGCAKERAKAGDASKKKRKKPRTFISPSELLQIPLDQEVVKRYVTLKYKTELESDKNTIYCPRAWCNGAARSKKHKKPEGLELNEASESESESESDDEEASTPTSGKSKPFKATEQLLAICEDCGFAFCSRCEQSWHGEFVRCYPRRAVNELTAEEQASLEYMKLHTTPCPTCAAPAQKTHGCNHMVCFRCDTHFCYLCSAWLDPVNPYQHFNEMPGGKITSCYMRLWELENGDGDDVGYDFEGGVARPAAQPRQQELVPEIEEPEDEEEREVPQRAAQPAMAQGHGAGREGEAREDGGQVGIAREGPLVLRIAANNQPAGAGRGGPRGRVAGHQQQHAGRGAGAALNQAAGAGARGGGRGAHGVAARGAAGRPVGGGQRGRGGPRAGAGAAPPHRQNNQANQAHQHQGQRRNININNGNAGAGARVPDDNELDEAQQAWVRQFVQLALNDEEDSDGDDFDLVLV